MDKKNYVFVRLKLKNTNLTKNKIQILIQYQYLAKFLSVKRVLNISLFTQIVKKIDLCVVLPKANAYRRDFGETKYMSFPEKLQEKYNEIWDKVGNTIKKIFYRQPIYNEKYLRTKIKSYEGKISTHFHGDKILKKGSPFICLSVILIDSVFRKG